MSKSTWSLVLVGAMAAWASFYPLAQTISAEVDPITLSFLRLLVAALVLLPFVLMHRALVLPPVRDLHKWLGLSLFAAAPPVLILIGIANSNTVVGAILMNTNPLMAALLAAFLLREHISGIKIFGLVIGFLGVVCVVMNGDTSLSFLTSSYFLGAAILLLAALISAVYAIFTKRFIQTYDGLFIIFATSLGSSLILLLFLLAKGGFMAISAISTSALLTIVMIGILSTALPYVLWASSLKKLDVSTATSFKLLIPIFTALYSFAFLHEAVTSWMIGGMVLTSAGIYLVQGKQVPTAS